MEVILTKDVRGLGYANDVVVVKPGYGRNFLIPRGDAIVANATNKKRIAENVRQAAHKMEAIRKEAEETAAKVADIAVELKAKVGTTGRIFGAITAAQIATQLKEKGIDIDRKKIVIDDPPKELGVYSVTLELHKEISAQLQISIVAEET